MSWRFFPGIFAPMYHEAASGKSVIAPAAATISVQPVSAAGLPSKRSMSLLRNQTMKSQIQSPCISALVGRLAIPDGLRGPSANNMLGQPDGNRVGEGKSVQERVKRGDSRRI